MRAGRERFGAMEFDLIRSLERNEAPPVISSAVSCSGPELSLELSLGPSSVGESCRKRPREKDEAAQGKKSKMADASFVKPVVFQAPVASGGIPFSGLLPAVAEESLVASTPQPAGSDKASSPTSGASGISDAFQISSSIGKKSCSDYSTPVLKHPPIRAAAGGNLAGRAPLAAARLPAVSTKSVAGKKTRGRLHRSSTNELRIICDCHGRIFLPEYFVRHAGVPVTAHPLRQIIMDCSD